MITAGQHDRHHARIAATLDAWLRAGGKVGDGFHVKRARTERRTFGLAINGHLSTGHPAITDKAKFGRTFAELIRIHDDDHEEG